MTALKLLKNEEGFKSKPYLDSLEVPTIGYGFTYITEAEAQEILRGRVADISNELFRTYHWFIDLTETRKSVIISMVYQLGSKGFSKFRKTILALAKEDYEEAAKEMLDSRWAKQTPKRANRQAKMLVEG